MKEPHRLVKIGFNALVMLSLLGCSLVSRVFSDAAPPPADEQAAATDEKPARADEQPTRAQVQFTPAPIRPALKTPQPGPTAGAQAVVDQIRVDYLYTSELITVIFPLYGSVLDDFVIVTIENGGSERLRLVVSSEIQGYSDAAVDTVEVGPGETVQVRQNPRLRPESIDLLNAAKPAGVRMRVTLLANGEEKILLDQTGETVLFARRDFPWAIEGFTQHEDFELLAAMVTPNDPAVEGLLRAAAEYTRTGTIWDGYGGDVDDSQGKVWDRLEALWLAEEEVYDLTYVSTMVSYAPGEVQRIRLPAEVLQQRSGNCVELALLFASATEALGLETALIRIPGHAYMAVRMDLENANYYVVETTMIGRASFADAVAVGSAEFNEMMPHLEAGEALYDWVTISAAREKGILPLPWH